MLQVTAQTELSELQSRVGKLIRQRDETIRYAHALIREANRKFDEIAIPVGRRINELRAELEAEATPELASRARSNNATTLDGLDDDDQQHYRELLAKRKTRK